MKGDEKNTCGSWTLTESNHRALSLMFQSIVRVCVFYLTSINLPTPPTRLPDSRSFTILFYYMAPTASLDFVFINYWGSNETDYSPCSQFWFRLKVYEQSIIWSLTTRNRTRSPFSSLMRAIGALWMSMLHNDIVMSI